MLQRMVLRAKMEILTGETVFPSRSVVFIIMVLPPSLWWAEFSISVWGVFVCLFFTFWLFPALQHSLTGTLIILTKVFI